MDDHLSNRRTAAEPKHTIAIPTPENGINQSCSRSKTESTSIETAASAAEATPATKSDISNLVDLVTIVLLDADCASLVAADAEPSSESSFRNVAGRWINFDPSE